MSCTRAASSSLPPPPSHSSAAAHELFGEDEDEDDRLLLAQCLPDAEQLDNKEDGEEEEFTIDEFDY